MTLTLALLLACGDKDDAPADDSTATTDDSNTTADDSSSGSDDCGLPDNPLVGSCVDCRDLTFRDWEQVAADVDRTFEALEK